MNRIRMTSFVVVGVWPLWWHLKRLCRHKEMTYQRVRTSCSPAFPGCDHWHGRIPEGLCRGGVGVSYGSQWTNYCHLRSLVLFGNRRRIPVCFRVSFSRVIDMSLMGRLFIILGLRFWAVPTSELALATSQAKLQRPPTGYFATPGVRTAWRWLEITINVCTLSISSFDANAVMYFPFFHWCVRLTSHQRCSRCHKRLQY